MLLALPAAASAFGPLSSFGSSGSGAGEIGAPGDLDIAADGSLYVPDFSNNRVNVFSPGGEFRFAFGRGVNPAGGDICTIGTGCAAGVQAATAGAMEHPERLALGPGGEVYVAGFLTNRVDVFSPQGEFHFAFGKGVNPGGGDICTVATGCRIGIADSSAGSLKPGGLTVDSAGTIYVASSARINVFSPSGQFQFAFGRQVNPQLGAANRNLCTAATECQAGRFDPPAGGFGGVDVDVTATGDLAILNSINRRVDIFSRQGEFRFAFGKNVNPGGGDTCTILTGCQAGDFGTAAGVVSVETKAIAADPAGFLYLANSQQNERVDQFTTGGEFIRAFGAGVIDGQEVFQICTIATRCRAGLRSTVPGATGVPEGVAVDRGGAVYVAERGSDQIERFGEPELPTVAPPAPSGPRRISARSFRFLALKLNRRKGTATLVVKVFPAGRVLLKGREISKAVRRARRPGIVRLPVVPVRKAKRELSATGRVRVKVAATFLPGGGGRLAKGKTLVLKKNLG